MSRYLRFTEDNDWEGESWFFYLPIEGNEASLEHLRALIAESDWYSLSDATFSKRSVKTIVKHSQCGYMKYENRARGVFKPPVDIDWTDEDPFNKGGILDFFSGGDP